MATEERVTGASDFGERLRTLRLSRGLSQEALAERARLSIQAISTLERGFRRTPQRSTLARLTAALALEGEDRREFEEAAARWLLLGRKGGALADAAWPDLGDSTFPLVLTSFVGREADLAEIAGLLRGNRLLTLTGAGGIGKTRTALHVTRTLRGPEYAAYFVALASVSNASLVTTTIASALRLRASSDRTVMDILLAYLKDKAIVLVLDNCEHLIAETARVVEELLAGCSRVRILATSREPLRVAGEQRYRLRSLNVEDAVVLFQDRAREVDHRYTIGDEDTPIVDELCRRLDGIPLAIELAAARVNMLATKTISAMLNDRFQLLAGSVRAAVPRQQTMRAAIDWSYDLLTPQEQLLFVRLGIFAGGFSLDAATAVCSGDGLDRSDIFSLLGLLADKSLVVVERVRDRERYRLLASTAAYALEKLATSGTRERLARRHAEYFCQEADVVQIPPDGPAIAKSTEIELELDNYRAALEWALTCRNDAVLGGSIAGALELFWRSSWLSGEGRRWIELGIQRVSEEEEPGIAARLQQALATLTNGHTSYKAAKRALKLYQRLGDERGVAGAQRRIGWGLYQMGRLDEAREVTYRALAAARDCEHHWEVAIDLSQLGTIRWNEGDFGGARELYAGALRDFQTFGSKDEIAHVLTNMAELEFAMSNPRHAMRLANGAAGVLSFERNAICATTCYNNIAAYSVALADIDGAYEAAREALRLARQVRDEKLLNIALQHLALIAALSGTTHHGARVMGYVDAQFSELGLKREYTEQWTYNKLLATLRETMSDEEIAKVAAEGTTLSEDKAVEVALGV
jgi:predicted ATPase